MPHLPPLPPSHPHHHPFSPFLPPHPSPSFSQSSSQWGSECQRSRLETDQLLTGCRRWGKENWFHLIALLLIYELISTRVIFSPLNFKYSVLRENWFLIDIVLNFLLGFLNCVCFFYINLILIYILILMLILFSFFLGEHCPISSDTRLWYRLWNKERKSESFS